jgi:hypothetical protein
MAMYSCREGGGKISQTSESLIRKANLLMHFQDNVQKLHNEHLQMGEKA